MAKTSKTPIATSKPLKIAKEECGETPGKDEG